MGNLWPTPQLCCGPKTALKSKDLTKTNLKNTRGKKEEKDGGREEGKARKNILWSWGRGVGRKPLKEKILNSNKKY